MNQSEYQIPPLPGGPRWTTVMLQTYTYYREHFLSLCVIALTPAILAYAYNYVSRVVIHQVYQIPPLPMDPRLFSTWIFRTLLWGSLIGFIRNSVFWCISAFFFAAVAIQVLNVEKHNQSSISDAYSMARARLGAILSVTLMVWTLYFPAKTAIEIALMFLSYRFPWLYNDWPYLACELVPLLMIAGLLSRFGLVIPELMCNSSISARDAIRNSIRKTENWEPFFMFFLVKSAVVGYGTYWLANRLFDELWNRASISASAYSWVTWAVYICIAAMLESPLFIAFSILYRELNAKPDEALAARAIG